MLSHMTSLLFQVSAGKVLQQAYKREMPAATLHPLHTLRPDLGLCHMCGMNLMHMPKMQDRPARVKCVGPSAWQAHDWHGGTLH